MSQWVIKQEVVMDPLHISESSNRLYTKERKELILTWMRKIKFHPVGNASTTGDSFYPLHVAVEGSLYDFYNVSVI